MVEKPIQRRTIDELLRESRTLQEQAATILQQLDAIRAELEKRRGHDAEPTMPPDC
jgi:hypothetical protein